MLKNDPLHVPEPIFGRMHTGAKLGFEARNGFCFDFLGRVHWFLLSFYNPLTT